MIDFLQMFEGNKHSTKYIVLFWGGLLFCAHNQVVMNKSEVEELEL